MSIEQATPYATIDQPAITKVIDEDKWINVQVDSQVLSMFMACPRKYEYVFVKHLKSIAPVSKSIRRGSIIHDALLAYWTYRITSGDDYQNAVKLAIESAKEGLSKQDDFDSDFKLESMQGMLDFLRYVQASSWIPLAAEKYFRIKAYEDESLKLRIYLTGKIDLILRTPQIHVLPVDNKTETERWFHSQMSNQFRIYCIATQTNLLGVQRVGFQKTLAPEDKFKMEILPFDQDILEEYRTITIPFWVKQMLIAHEEGFFAMNNTNCVHGHFKCQFSDGADHKGICNVSRAVREQKLGRYFVIGEEWDPSKV